MARIRSRIGNPITGSGVFNGAPVEFTSYAFRENMTDIIGDYGGNHTLSHRKIVTTGSMLTRPSGGLLTFPVETPAPSAFYGRDWVNPNNRALSTYLNQLLAASGPLSPKIYLPLFIYELKDIPNMLRHAGDLLHKIKRPSGLDPAKELAAANLAWKFGWDPLIGDLGKLLNFADAARRQQHRIAQANTARGIRRKVHLGEESASVGVPPSLGLWSVYGLNISTDTFHGSANSKVWGTVRWTVRDPKRYGYKPSFNESLRTALGLNLGHIPIAIWKALPWTWMVDWFADISNVMQINYNSIYYKPSRASIMRQTTLVARHQRVPVSGGPLNEVSEGQAIVTFHERYANNSPSASVTLRLPFMDSYKLSVLGSLAILRMK